MAAGRVGGLARDEDDGVPQRAVVHRAERGADGGQLGVAPGRQLGAHQQRLAVREPGPLRRAHRRGLSLRLALRRLLRRQGQQRARAPPRRPPRARGPPRQPHPPRHLRLRRPHGLRLRRPERERRAAGLGRPRRRFHPQLCDQHRPDGRERLLGGVLSELCWVSLFSYIRPSSYLEFKVVTNIYVSRS